MAFDTTVKLLISASEFAYRMYERYELFFMNNFLYCKDLNSLQRKMDDKKMF